MLIGGRPDDQDFTGKPHGGGYLWANAHFFSSTMIRDLVKPACTIEAVRSQVSEGVRKQARSPWVGAWLLLEGQKFKVQGDNVTAAPVPSRPDGCSSASNE